MSRAVLPSEPLVIVALSRLTATLSILSVRPLSVRSSAPSAVPHQHRLVPRATHYRRTAGAHGDRERSVGVPLERAQLRAVGRAPQPYRLVDRAAHDHRAVVAHDYRAQNPDTPLECAQQRTTGRAPQPQRLVDR